MVIAAGWILGPTDKLPFAAESKYDRERTFAATRRNQVGRQPVAQSVQSLSLDRVCVPSARGVGASHSWSASVP